ncbi:sensor histidine kinase [Fibrella aquatilis]|uniref:Oxygen sensor histidine kinase NreB n=1 Tax=Fibrella aquatilis TaxID=2817059 RepID=A0A939G4D9_9BACT|nr:ATP-binding protein [Fibrella aquatilis]MBO0932157.1 sensor histidine kinase [Fibrella aquatilis]
MKDNLYLVVVASTVIFLLLSVFIVSFLLLFQRRQLQNIREKIALKATYEQEILQAQIEVQNQTLQQVGNDLHDNIGQLLSLTKLHLNAMEEEADLQSAAVRLVDIGAVVDLAIREVRALTKSLDKEFVEQFGLVSSIQNELNRLEQMGRFATAFDSSGQSYSLGFKREVILFRVVQECLNNTIKHADAEQISIHIAFKPEQFELTISDDGRGFDQINSQNLSLNQSGAGLRTMQRRVELIEGKCHIESTVGQGTRIELTIPVVPHPASVTTKV